MIVHCLIATWSHLWHSCSLRGLTLRIPDRYVVFGRYVALQRDPGRCIGRYMALQQGPGRCIERYVAL